MHTISVDGERRRGWRWQALLVLVPLVVLVASACRMPASPSVAGGPSAGPAASGDFAGLIDVGGRQCRTPPTTSSCSAPTS